MARVTIDSAPVPDTLRWAVRLLRAEAVALALLAGWLVWADLTATKTDLVSALFVTGFAIAGAVALWALAGALACRRAGARAPAMVLELMLVPVGWFMISGGLGWLGAPLIVLGVGVCALLVSPPTTRALGFG